MGFNDQAAGLSGARGARKFIFKEGVRFKHMTGQAPIMFRIMPAFNPADPNPGTSWQPCLDPAGNLTDWGTVLKIVRFVGHGTGGAGARMDLLSLKTFENPGQPIWCPLDALYQAITSDAQTWGYLIEDKGDFKDKNKVRAAFGRMTSHLVCNILDINQLTQGVQLAVFTSGASVRLIDKKDGLIYQPSGAINVDDLVKQNYMWAYANGDITCPHTAPLLVVEKGNEKGEFSAYKITPATDAQRRVIRNKVDQDQMTQRYRITDLASFINIPTEDDLVQSLIQLLNGRSPAGYHEHALLRMAFPHHQVPEPPMMPAGTSTVAMGGFAPQGGGFAPAPTHQGIPAQPSIPGTMPQQGIPGMPPQQGIPGMMPQQMPQQPQQMPPSAIPAMPPSAIPGMPPQQGIPGMMPQQGIPAQPSIPGTMPQQPQQMPQQQMPLPQQPQQTPQAPAQGEPLAPGDAVGAGWNPAEFLARVRAQGGQPQQ